MARRRFAPSHSLLARALYIPADDSAWDHERIDKEAAEIRREAGWEPERPEPHDTDVSLAAKQRRNFITDPARDQETGHPFFRYQMGFTRYDLDADHLRDYLDESKNPERWTWKRLGIEERRRFESLADLNRGRAQEFAVMAGLTGLDLGTDENTEPDLLEAGRKLSTLLVKYEPKDRSEQVRQQILEAFENFSEDALYDVGERIYESAKDLTAQEKKVSDAPPGGG